MKRLLLFLSLLLFSNNYIFASGSVTGLMTTPSVSTPIINGTLTFTLNQAGIDVSQSYVLASTSVSCYTDGSGNIKGVPDALVMPSYTTTVGTGSLASGTYYARIAYYIYDSGSMMYTYGKASPEVTIVLSGTGEITITAPTLRPANAGGYAVFMSTTSNTEKLQSNVSGFVNYTQATSLAVMVSYPTSNSTSCSFTFNDSIIPTDTRYRTNFLDGNGRQVAGWPRVYNLVGSSVNLATMTPSSAPGQVQFPYPILSNPLSQVATQSINSNLTLNQFHLTAGGLELPTPSNNCTPQTGRTVICTDTTGVAKISENGGAFANLAGGSGGWQINGSDIVETNTGRAVLVGWSSSDLSVQGGGSIAGGVIARNGVYIVDIGTGSVNSSVNGQVLGIGVDTSTSSAFIGSTVSGTQATGWPLTIKLCDPTENCAMVGTHEWFKFKGYSGGGSGQFIAGNNSTDASGSQGSIFGIGGVTAANATVNAVLTRLQSTGGGGGRGKLIVDKTGTAGYVPFDVNVSNTDVLELDGSAGAVNTAMLLYHNGMLKRVKMQTCLSDDMVTVLNCLTF